VVENPQKERLESARGAGRKILIISPWASRWSLGGEAGVSDDFNFIEHFTKAGYELHFLSPKAATASDFKVDGFYTHTYPNFFKPTQNWPTSIRRILWPTLYNAIVPGHAVRLARRIRPDFVLGHSHFSALASYITREFFQIPSAVKLFGVMDLVHTEWSQWKYNTKNLEQILALKVPQDAWIILDDGTRGDEAALRHGVPESRVHFLPNGIDLNWVGAASESTARRDEFGLDNDSHIVLFLARLVASKRPELLLQAVPDVTRRIGKSVQFVFAGDGEERTSLEALATKMQINDSVRFLGALPHARVPDIMALSDVFVSTSSLTNVAIPTCEALVCGLPVVTMDVGNTADIVKDGETGRLVADGDVQGLAAAIADLLGDPTLRGEMGQRARELAKARFTGWEERTSMEMTIIDRIIATRS